MSPRTTIVLVVLLAVAGAVIWWLVRADAPAHEQGRRLLPGLVTADVAGILIDSERADVPLRGGVSLKRQEDGVSWQVVRDGRTAIARAERVRALLDTLREASFLRERAAAEAAAPEKVGLVPGKRLVVTIESKGSAARRLEFGAVAGERTVVVRVDSRWPPVEVDRQILDDLAVEPAVWRETRIAPFDATMAQSVRAVFPKSPESGFAAQRESGQWQIREPSLLRPDQSLLARLLASLSALESQGPVDARGAAPEVLVRYEVGVAGAPKALVVEVGAEARAGGMTPVRSGTDPEWQAASLGGLDLIGQPVTHFRSRRLLHLDAEEVREVVATRAGGDGLHLRRAGSRLLFEPPAAWGWGLRGSGAMPLDPSAQSDFLQLLLGLEAADFAAGPAFEPELSLSVRHGGGDSETRIRFGREADGKRPMTRFEDKAEGHVRSSDLAFLDRPYFELLARNAYAAAWFSLTTIEVEEVGKRKAVIAAVSTAGNEPEFVVSEPATPRRRVPREVLNPVTDKICLLTVEKFVAHGVAKEHGLDQPRYVIRWLDSGKTQGTPPDPKVGQWVTWRVGARGPDGLNHGDLSIHPGLVFKTGARDLDPFVNLLEWVFQ